MVTLSKGVSLVKASDVENRTALNTHGIAGWVVAELNENNLNILSYVFKVQKAEAFKRNVAAMHQATQDIGRF